MTDREKAIIMAYTGFCMLREDKIKIYHKYVEDIMGRPVYTHELADKMITDEIKEKAKDDFIALCADTTTDDQYLNGYSDGFYNALERLKKEFESRRDYLLSLNKHYNPTAKDNAYGINWCINTINDIVEVWKND